MAKTDTRKAQLGVGLDSSEVVEGFGTIEAGAKRLATSVDDIGNKSDQSTQKLDRSTRSLINSIQRATAEVSTLGKSSADRYEALAKLRSLDPGAIKPYTDALREAEKQADQLNHANKNLGMSAKQLEFALRGVPAQFTDIAVSLASGQAPMTVLLQQGGQLKDMFGGVGAAAKALGGYVLSLVNPLTVVAATVGTLAYAYEKGTEESRKFAQSLILTNNAAGTYVSRLNEIASTVSAATGASRGAVAELLNQLVGTGKVAGDSLKIVSQSITAMTRATGQSADDLVKSFAELGKSPVDALLKLNDQYNFLTAATYKQVKALEDVGDATGAATYAQQAFAKANIEMADGVKQNLGTIETVWRNIKDAAIGAWDAMLGIGREDLARELQKAKDVLDGNGGIFSFGGKSEALATISVIEARLEKEKRVSEEKAKQSAFNRAAIEWEKESDKFLSKKEQMERDIAKARQAGIAAQRSEEDIAKRIGVIREKYAEKSGKNAINKEVEELSRLLKNLDEAQSGMDFGLSPETVKSYETLAVALDKNRISIERYNAALSTVLDKDPVLKKQQEELTRELKEQEKARQEYMRGIGDETAKILEKARASEEENAKIGMSVEQLKLLIGSRYDELISIKETESARLRGIDGRESELFLIEQQVAALQKLKSAEIARPRLEAQARAWENFTRDIEQSLTDALMRSFEAGNGFGKTFAQTLVNTFKSMVLKVAVQAIVQPVMQGVSNVSGQPSAGGESSLLSLGSNAYSLYNGGGAGGLYGNFATSSFGAGLGLSTSASAGALSAAAGGGEILSAGSLAVGAAESAGAAGALASGGSALTGVGAAIPYIGWAIAAIALLSSVFGSDKSGPKAGYKVDFGYKNDEIESLFRNGKLSKGETGQQFDEYFTKYLRSTDKGLTSLGLSDSFTSLFNYTLNPMGDGPGSWSYGFTKDGFDFKRRGHADQKDPKDALGKIDTAFGEMWAELLKSDLIAPEVKKITDAMTALGIAAKDVPEQLDPFKDFLRSLDKINKTADDAVVSLGETAGGLENLKTLTASYIDNFYTEQEKVAISTESLSAAFGKLGYTLPKTAAEYRALVEAVDAAADGGSELLISLLGLGSAFRVVSEQASAVLDKTLEGQANQIGKLFDAQRAAQQQAIEINRASLSDQVSKARELADTFSEIVDSLTDYKASLLLGSQTILNPRQQYEVASRIYRETAAKAKLGDKDAAVSLQSAVDSFLKASLSIAPDQSTYAVDFADAMNSLDATIGTATRQEDIWRKQLAVAEEQLAALNRIAAGGDSSANPGEKNLPIVVNDFAKAMADWEAWFTATTIGQSSAFDIGTTTRISNDKGIFTDKSGQSFVFSREEGPYALAEESMAWAKEMIKRYGQWKAPGFASGGMHSGGWRLVGEKGPELEATGAARIFNANDTRQILNSANDEELRAMRAEIRSLMTAVSETSAKTAKILSRWDGDGMPDIRTAA